MSCQQPIFPDECSIGITILLLVGSMIVALSVGILVGYSVGYRSSNASIRDLHRVESANVARDKGKLCQ